MIVFDHDQDTDWEFHWDFQAANKYNLVTVLFCYTEDFKIFIFISLDWLQEPGFPILVWFCPESELEQNEIFFWWDETESDFIFMKWDRTEFFFMRWDETEDESSFNEMKSSFHETKCLILILWSV